MGNGRSGLTKNSAGYSAYSGYSKLVKQFGYTLKKSKSLGDVLNDDGRVLNSLRKEAIENQFNSLQAYRNAMDNPTNVEGTITYKPILGAVSANTNPNNVITVNANLLTLSDGDELVHEDTHNLVHSLITKELGFNKGSSEYYKAYTDGAIERDIQLKAYEAWYKESTGKEAGIIVPDDYKNAISSSNMRDYALKQYPWTQKGTYIEIPTVAAECFHSVNYNWNELHKQYPYAYHVMRELYRRLHKHK